MVLVKVLKAPNLLGRWVFVETDRTNDEIQFKVGQITLSIEHQHLARMRPANGAPVYSQLCDLWAEDAYI